MRFLLSVWVLTVLLIPLAALRAEDPPSGTVSTKKRISRHWLQVSRDYAESFTVSPSDADDSPFVLLEQPIFRHTQSVRGDDIGAVHLWHLPDTRPAAVGVIFAWTNSKTARTVAYEFHSLTDARVQLRSKKKLIWRSDAPGLRWTGFPTGTKAPGKSKRLLRRQANQLARKFDAETTTGEGEKWNLRLIPTPIYQYASKEGGVSHGSMYAFCQGTDTEVLLLIEAFRSADDAAPSPVWRYALAPFTDYQAVVNYDQDQVWESPAGQLNENGKPHYWGFVGSSPKPEFEIESDDTDN